MRYVILTIKWCEDKGLVVPSNVRKSLDGTKVILHEDFIRPVLVEEDEINSYEYDSEKLLSILNSSEWTETEELK